MSQQYIIPSPGDVVAEKFRIERELGRGAYGVVFRAHQEAIGRDVALKTLLPKGFLDDEIVERFEREARFVGRLDHPNIVSVYDSGRHDNLLYMAVEYVEGPTLDEIIAEEGGLEPERAYRLLAQLIDALAHAHERGIVHRDLKPANIVVVERRDTDGVVHEQIKVLDFGIAKLLGAEADEDQPTLTQAGAVLGTPHYMSPETISAEELDERADIYALGVIIYEMLTGRRPFEAKTSAGVMVDHLRTPPPPLPEPLEHTGWGLAVRGCLKKDPDERFQSVVEVRRALERRDEKIRSKSSQKRRLLLAAVAVGALSAAAIAVGIQWFDRAPERPAAAASADANSEPDAGPSDREATSARADDDKRDAGEKSRPDADAGETDASGGDAGVDAADSERPTVVGRAEKKGPRKDAGAARAKPDGDRPSPRQSSRGDVDTATSDADEQADPARSADDSAQADQEEDEPDASSEKASKRVRIRVESNPTDSRVTIDGEPAGQTPLDHQLQRGDKAVDLQVSHIGFEPESRRIVPDRDRTVEVELEKGRLKLER